MVNVLNVLKDASLAYLALLKGLPNYPHFGTHPTFLVILSPFRLFFSPLTQAWAKLYRGTGHTVIVYVPTACTTKGFHQ